MHEQDDEADTDNNLNNARAELESTPGSDKSS